MVLPIKHADGDPNFYEMVITIDGDMVTTETGIPLMRNANLPGVDSTGKDVRLEKMDGTPIPREIECVGVPNADDVAFHFPFDTISATDSQFVVKWGNTNLTEPAASSTYGKNNVYSSDTILAYKMNNLISDTPPQLKDGAGNINATAYNMADSNVIDGDYGKKNTFDGVNEHYWLESSYTNQITGSTVSVTFEYTPSTLSQTNNPVIEEMETTTTKGMLVRVADDGVNMFAMDASSFSVAGAAGLFDTIGQRYVVTVTYDQSNVRVYVDGVLKASPAMTRAIVASPTRKGYIARDGNGAGTYDGYHHLGSITMDNVVRSTNYVTTTHNNLNNPTASGTAPFYLADGPIQHQRRTPQYI